MKISTASIASIAILASSADLVLARNGRVLKSSKAGGRGKGKWSIRRGFASLYRVMAKALNKILYFSSSLQVARLLPVALDSRPRIP